MLLTECLQCYSCCEQRRSRAAVAASDDVQVLRPRGQQLCGCTAVNSVVWQPPVQGLCSCIGWVADELDQWLEGRLLLTADETVLKQLVWNCVGTL
ncbi:hypothetical protein MRB53_009268 [Persea americana]|uniref:Uncharacterized protein n=1 Tax=Persea americana TaxID=3435 RepID=A0ACC2LPP8_PERAE|nr:hypothetical protein MRB53_009268 [Persea americana]